jgi:hypothetical protein
VITNLKQSLQWIYEQVTVSGATSRIGLKNCATECRLDGPVARTFGEHVPGATDGGGVCADARDPPSPGTDSPLPGTSLDLARTFLRGAQVVVTVRRIVLHLPQAFPYRDSFQLFGLEFGRSNPQFFNPKPTPVHTYPTCLSTRQNPTVNLTKDLRISVPV